MARRIVQTLVDDMDGTEADETINFSFEGLEYRIDLSEKNADKFRKAIAPFLKAAQRVGGRAKRGKASVTRLPSGAAVIRAWAIEHGYEMPGRGRIPKDVRAAYEAAQGILTPNPSGAALPSSGGRHLRLGGVDLANR